MTTAPIRGHEAWRQMTALNAACPARNRPTPPRISQEVAARPTAAGSASVTSSAAAPTMIPAIMTGWMK
jgi:hypothetical protein